MAAFTFTMTNDTVVDYTSIAVNPEAQAMSTPRQGGFTLRNRWNCSNVTNAATFAASDIAAVASTAATVFTTTPFAVLDVPARTLVRDISVFAIPGETAPDHAYNTTATSVATGDITAGLLNFYAAPWKKAAGTSVATYVNMGGFTLTATGSGAKASNANGSIAGSLLTLSASASALSVPTNAAAPMLALSMTNAAFGASTVQAPKYFPYGGRVMLRLGAHTTTLSKSASASAVTALKAMSGAISGVWDVQAQCQYVPE